MFSVFSSASQRLCFVKLLYFDTWARAVNLGRTSTKDSRIQGMSGASAHLLFRLVRGLRSCCNVARTSPPAASTRLPSLHHLSVGQDHQVTFPGSTCRCLNINIQAALASLHRRRALTHGQTRCQGPPQSQRWESAHTILRCLSKAQIPLFLLTRVTWTK